MMANVSVHEPVFKALFSSFDTSSFLLVGERYLRVCAHIVRALTLAQLTTRMRAVAQVWRLLQGELKAINVLFPPGLYPEEGRPRVSVCRAPPPLSVVEKG